MFLYPTDILNKLDFDRILKVLSTFCKGQIARDRCIKIAFFSQKARVERMLEEVEECMNAIIQQQPIPISEYENISEDVAMLAKENYVLDVEPLVKIIGQVRIINALVAYGSSKDYETLYPNLKKILDQIEYNPEILKRFDKVFDVDNTIKPDASPGLLKISKAIASKERQIAKEFESVAAKFAKLGYLTDNVESYRNGRRVLSVTAENKRKIDGIIHDESASGKTVFLEPAELTHLTNELYEFESERRQEIYRIVRELCSFLRPFAAQFDLWQKVIARLDLIQAKAKLAVLMDGARPKINTEGRYIFENARNPYLIIVNHSAKKDTIPFDLSLDRKTRILIISGPNAGGKSVTMKGTGIILLMVQCGLLPPVDANSDIGLPSKLLCDIGDQQSIEDDLSTYSSRLKHMLYFLENADKNTFLLIDEFGSGTDPKVGGALAEAILHKVHQKQVQGVITTHYSNIKMYGYETKGIANGAMIFDNKKLEPTYKLQQGKPGSSYAFEIANKIGLPQEIIEYAKQKSGKNVKAIDDLLADLQNDKKELEKKLAKAEDEKKNFQRLLDQYQTLHKEYEVKKKTLNVQIKENNFRSLDEESRELKKVIKDLKAQKDLETAEKRLVEVKVEQKKVEEDILMIKDQLHKSRKVSYVQLAVGDYVKLQKSMLLGQIIEKNKKKYQLLVGDMTMHVHERDIIPSKYEPVQNQVKRAVKTDLVKTQDSIESELDIRGYRKSEAEEFIKEFMDDAFLGTADILTVIHGTGSGVLKKTLLYMLKEYKGIKRVWSPEEQYGGQGVTYIQI